MIWEVRWDQDALKDLSALGAAEARRIVKKTQNYLSRDPQGLGKALGGSLAGYYRYRIGDYRVIYQIFRKEIRVDVVRVGHRKDIYFQ